MIPKFVQIGTTAFNKDTIDYILVKDSDSPEEYEGFSFCVSLANKDYIHTEVTEKYPIEEMEEYLSNFDYVTIKDKFNGDVYSINTKNIFYIERNLDKFVRIHFENSILVIVVKEEKDAEEIIKTLVEWN